VNGSAATREEPVDSPRAASASERRAGAGESAADRDGSGARRRILDAAVERIARDGIDEVRIARIATDAGVSTSLVHYHFETREALVAEALEHSYELAGDERIGEADVEVSSHAARLADMVDSCLPFPGTGERDWILWVELWLRAVRDPDLRPIAARLYRRMRVWFRDEIVAGIEAGELAECEVEPLVDRVLALIDGFGVRALLGDPEVSIERARAEVWETLAQALGLQQR
jgi:AcrR family transcriptional regulator